MKANRTLTIVIFIFLLGFIACARTDLTRPEHFKYSKGIVTHVVKNIFVVESDDGQKMTFLAGRNTVFRPRLARRMRDFLFASMSLQIYHLIKPDSKGRYTAFEVLILDRKKPVSRNNDNNSSIRTDAYGLGVHSNRSGQAIRLVPDGDYAPGERLEIKPDAYGPGIHMDQYGRPVREVPAFGK